MEEYLTEEEGKLVKSVLNRALSGTSSWLVEMPAAASQIDIVAEFTAFIMGEKFLQKDYNRLIATASKENPSAGNWLFKASKDILVAEALKDKKFMKKYGVDFFDSSVLHSQQAIEKALKGWLMANTGKYTTTNPETGKERRPTHSIEELARAFMENTTGVRFWSSEFRNLTRDYEGSRYPDKVQTYDAEAAERAYSSAKNVLYVVAFDLGYYRSKPSIKARVS